MSRDEQIEEMAKDMCEYYYEGTCYQDKKPCDCKCDIFTDAQYLYSKGYRKVDDIFEDIFEGRLEVVNKKSGDKLKKASDVAEEIFAEIEEGIKSAVSALQFENNPIHRKVKHETYSSLMRFVKTIEKKYTESEKGNADNNR